MHDDEIILLLTFNLIDVMKDSCDRGLAENALHDLGFEQTKNKPHHEKSRIGNFDCISE